MNVVMVMLPVKATAMMTNDQFEVFSARFDSIEVKLVEQSLAIDYKLKGLESEYVALVEGYAAENDKFKEHIKSIKRLKDEINNVSYRDSSLNSIVSKLSD